MYGFYTNNGYCGKIKNGKIILFATENEYKEYIENEGIDIDNNK